MCRSRIRPLYVSLVLGVLGCKPANVSPVPSAATAPTVSSSAEPVEEEPEPPAKRYIIELNQTTDPATGDRELVVSIPEAKISHSIATLKSYESCILDPDPSLPHHGSSRATPLPLGLWLRCGFPNSGSVGVGAVGSTLVINREKIDFPESTIFVFPAPPVELLKGSVCPDDSPSKKVHVKLGARISKDPEHGGEQRYLFLDIPEMHVKFDIDELHKTYECVHRKSKKYMWFRENCTNGPTRYSHSTLSTTVDVDGRTLLIKTTWSGVDDSTTVMGAIRLPCGAGVEYSARDIPALTSPTGAMGGGGCLGGCERALESCEKRCFESFADEHAEPSEEYQRCFEPCYERYETCATRCEVASLKPN